MIYLLMILLGVMAIFLIMLVLVQRGRGGGLAGAFGGMGGQSAFGTKAGDLFTRITIVVATVWILLCIVSIKLLSNPDDPLSNDFGRNAPQQNQGSLPGGAQNTSPNSTPKKSTPAGATRPRTGGAANRTTTGSNRTPASGTGTGNRTPASGAGATSTPPAEAP